MNTCEHLISRWTQSHNGNYSAILCLCLLVVCDSEWVTAALRSAFLNIHRIGYSAAWLYAGTGNASPDSGRGQSPWAIENIERLWQYQLPACQWCTQSHAVQLFPRCHRYWRWQGAAGFAPTTMYSGWRGVSHSPLVIDFLWSRRFQLFSSSWPYHQTTPLSVCLSVSVSLFLPLPPSPSITSLCHVPFKRKLYRWIP